VVAAIIFNQGKVLIAQRKSGDFSGLWEFPGGKIESGETHSEALRRELLEELEISILIDKFFMTVDYDYSSFHLTMHCYICSVKDKSVVLNDHKQIEWVTIDEIKNYNWLPADIKVVDTLVKKLAEIQ